MNYQNPKAELVAFAVGADCARRLGYKPSRRHKNVRRLVFVLVWSRDCDMCESDRIYTIPATLRSYNELYDDEERNAEGPFTLEILSAEEAAEHRPQFRDRILEAWENGETYSV